MQRRTTRFMELTGYRFTVTLRDASVSDPALFSRLENTATRLLEIIVALPQAQLESMRRQDRADVYPYLAPDAFGFYNDLRPLDTAVATLNEMIAKGREIPRRN
jgi:hypothetical protein